MTLRDGNEGQGAGSLDKKTQGGECRGRAGGTQGRGTLPLRRGDVQAVLFDLDGTLRHSRPSFSHALFEYAAEFGVLDEPERRRQALRWSHYYYAASPEILEDLEKTGQDRDLFMTRYLQRYLVAYGSEPARAEELAPRLHLRLKTSLQQQDFIDPEAPETLRWLKTAGFVLGVVSNREKTFAELLDVLELGHYFDFVLAAGEVNSWKPDELIFQHAVELAGTSPACTMYVGDNYYADIVGAQRAGLEAVLLDPDDLFPEADCPVIRSLSELIPQQD